jgi:hypothetical protein
LIILFDDTMQHLRRLIGRESTISLESTTPFQVDYPKTEEPVSTTPIEEKVLP